MNVQREFVGVLFPGPPVQEFAYRFDFDAPLSLEADTVYWLGLNMGPAGLSFSAAWLRSSSGAEVLGQPSATGSVAALPEAGRDQWLVVTDDRAFVLTGVALPEPTAVEIDVSPGSEPNPINPTSEGLVSVALLGSDSFHVREVDRRTLAFGPEGAAPAQRSWGRSDVNHDGFPDLVPRYRVSETGIDFGDTEACLRGQTIDGMRFQGCDAIDTTPHCGLGFELALLLPPLAWLRRRRSRLRQAVGR